MVYTRGGDKGMTSLVGGQRVSKQSVRLEAYGTVDELNSVLGVVISYLEDKDDIDFLLQVQHQLFSIGGYLATDTTSTQLTKATTVEQVRVDEIEARIDAIDGQLPKLSGFILPSGSRGAAFCHQARTVCRRAERRILALTDEAEIDSVVIAFINRLSDYLFVQARKMNQIAGATEVFWNNI